jgi:hypothetical protein
MESTTVFLICVAVMIIAILFYEWIEKNLFK